MKISKTITALACVGVLSMVAYGFQAKDDDYKVYNPKSYINEQIAEKDSVTKELLAKMQTRSDETSVEYWLVESTDGSLSYNSIDGHDDEHQIFINARYRNESDGSAFITKDGAGISINYNNGMYYKHPVDDSNNNSSRNITRGEAKVMSFLESSRTVEKTADGYKATIDDGLNYGYDLYDENGLLYESYLENSEGKFLSKLIDRSYDVEAVYHDFYASLYKFEETDEIANVK